MPKTGKIMMTMSSAAQIVAHEDEECEADCEAQYDDPMEDEKQS